MIRIGRAFAVCAVLAASTLPAFASPWAEVGDGQLRSDIEILATAGVIDDITTHWPLPWASIVSRLRAQGVMHGQPGFVREAAERVLATASDQMRINEMRVSATVDGTNAPAVVRGFDSLGRETAQGQVSAEYMTDTTAVRLSIGGELQNHTGRAAIVPDGSYVAQKIGGATIYGGYITHWWGPGWISALSLSNNAHPMPQIGIERDSTDAFRTPWLSWLGPWQAEFFVGWLDDSRVAVNTVYPGFRFTFNPLHGLEIGLARTTQMCGTGHSCVPLRDYFDLQNDNNAVNHTNDEGLIDVKYSTMLGRTPAEVYMQLMNEDSSPVSHSDTSHLFGASLWLPIGAAAPLRLTAEYSDTVPTVDIFSFGDVAHGDAYNNGGYIDGMRYRGRTLGFSLDSDSTLFTLQGAWRGAGGWSYELTYHHAAVDNPNNTLGNAVTTAPVHINLGEARVSFPFHGVHIDLEGRLADDQPRPFHGFQAAIEAGLSITL
jgi:hypothetical protein